MKKLLEMVNTSSYSLGMPAAAKPPKDTEADDFDMKIKKKKILPKPAQFIKSKTFSLNKESSGMRAVRVYSTSNRQLAKAYYEISAKGDTNASIWTFGAVKLGSDGKFFFDVEGPANDQFFGAKELMHLLPPQVEIKDISADEVQIGRDHPTDKDVNKDPSLQVASDLRIHPLVVEHMSHKGE